MVFFSCPSPTPHDHVAVVNTSVFEGWWQTRYFRFYSRLFSGEHFFFFRILSSSKHNVEPNCEATKQVRRVVDTCSSRDQIVLLPRWKSDVDIDPSQHISFLFLITCLEDSSFLFHRRLKRPETVLKTESISTLSLRREVCFLPGIMEFRMVGCVAGTVCAL